MQNLLNEQFLTQYADYPPEMTPLGLFVYLRTYSRFITALKRRETYKETCIRATQYNCELLINHYNKIGYNIDPNEIIKEAQMLFDNMYHLRQFVSGRTMWIGGTEAAKKYSLSNFNCAALNITKWKDLCDLFYLLMVGTGVGFKSNKTLLQNMPPIRANTKLIHSDYIPLPKHERLEQTKMIVLPNGFAKIYIGDSKEGWVDGLGYYFNLLTDHANEYIHTIKISYNSVRPRGERLYTFGGTSSGPEPLKEMFIGIDKTIKGTLDPWLEPPQINENGYVHLRPIHIMDIGNLIGQNVVVGGVRRCIKRGSLIHLKRGLVPIENVKIGDDVLTQTGYNKITDWFDQGERELVRINTLDGYFECTENHRMPVLKGLNKIEWVPANQLQPYDILMTSRTPIDGVKTHLPLNGEFEPILDVDTAWFIGLFMVSGCVEDNTIKISLDLHNTDIFNKIINQLIVLSNNDNNNVFTMCEDVSAENTILCHNPQLSTYIKQHFI